MRSFGRPRQYVSAARLYAMYPVLRFSYDRGAYVLRLVGETRGPVLRKNRRRRQRAFTGPDRRDGGVDLFASRPLGTVRRTEVNAAAAHHGADAPRPGRSARVGGDTAPREGNPG